MIATMSHDQNQTTESGSFATGVVLGTLLGGVSLFLFGTKTGKKIHHQLKSEFEEGGFNFEDLQQKTNQKLDQFFKTTNVSEHFQKLISQTKSKTQASNPKSSPKPKKQFFQKKGKALR